MIETTGDMWVQVKGERNKGVIIGEVYCQLFGQMKRMDMFLTQINIKVDHLLELPFRVSFQIDYIRLVPGYFLSHYHHLDPQYISIIINSN